MLSPIHTAASLALGTATVVGLFRRYGLPAPLVRWIARVAIPGVGGVSTAEISQAEVAGATRDALPAFEAGEGDLIYTDRTFYAAHDPAALAPIADLIALLPYRATRFDCETFAGAYRTLVAFLLGANAVGIVYDWSADHTYNIILDADGEPRLFEPQDGHDVELGDSDLYVGEHVLVVF
jgi:hypothetical protein